MADKLSRDKILLRYQHLKDIWPPEDLWHSHSRREIHGTVNAWIQGYSCSRGRILNIGSGGSSYGLSELDMVQTDLCNRNLPSANGVVCDAENLSFINETFDAVICVGSVLNYCDALLAISEMARVLKKGGLLIIEFEKSDSFEYLGTGIFGKNAAIATTFYAEEEEKIWVYSERYVCGIIHAMGLTCRRRKPVHIFSSLFVKFIPVRLAATLASIDGLASTIPLLRRYSTNIIFLCEKSSPAC